MSRLTQPTLRALHAALLVLAVTPVLAAGGEDPLAGDVRLDIATSLTRGSALNTEAVRALAAEAEVDAVARPAGNSGIPRLAFAFATTPLRHAFAAIAEFLGWIWERQEDGKLVLRPRRSVAAWDAMNRMLLPQTEAGKTRMRNGLDFVAGAAALPPAARRALQSGVDQGGGIPISELPAKMQQHLGAALDAAVGERVAESGLPNPIEDWRSGRVGIETGRLEQWNIHQIAVRHTRGRFGFSVNNYRPGPPPPDETLRDPREVERERAERRRLLEADPRMAAKVTFEGSGATVVEALTLFSQRAGIPVVCDHAEARDDRHAYSVRNVPAREAVETLRRVFGFDWERTRDGVLIVRAADYHPDIVARREAVSALVGGLSALPPDTLKALAREDGLAFSDLPPDMQRAARTLIAQNKSRSMNDDQIAGCKVRIFTTERKGALGLTFGVTYDSGVSVHSWSTGMDVARP